MIDRAIMGISVAVVLTVLAVALLLLVLPLFQRLEFDLVCQAYVRRMDAGGGLASAQLSALAAELTGRGYSVEVLDASASAPFGGSLTLSVQVSRQQRQVAPDLTLKEGILSLSFTRTVICRRIITAAGEP